MGIFVGGTGSGKTYAALRTAWELDRSYNGKPRFNIDRVVFSAADFLELVKKDMPRGSVIIWDETGVGINSRLFYEQNNMAISFTTQTFRFKNYIVLYTTPSFSYVDKQVRQLFHARVRMLGCEPRRNTSWGLFSWMDYNSDSGKIYYKYPRIKVNTRKVIMDKIFFQSPPSELAKQYEEKREAVMAKLYDQYQTILNAKQNANSNKTDYSSMVEEVKSNISEYVDNKGKVVPGKIQLKFGIGLNRAQSVAKLVRISAESQ